MSDLEMDSAERVKLQAGADAGHEGEPNSIPTEVDFEQKFPDRPRNKNPTLKFHVLYTKLFEPLLENKKKTAVGLRGKRELKPHEIRRRIIDQFVSRWRQEVGPDFFPAFRLILCDKDRDRNVYVKSSCIRAMT
jgi:DNA ligase-4